VRRVSLFTAARCMMAVALAGALACAGARHVEPAPAAAAARAMLFAPDAPFWRVQAPSTFRVRVETTRGPFTLELTRALAPIGVDHFYNLVRAGYYDDSRFSRTIAGWISQFGVAGDPAVSAVWANRAIRDDPVRASNIRGSLTFAMTGPDTRTTQISISRRDNVRQDGEGFAPLGYVVEGMEVVDSLYSGYGERSGGGMRAGKQQRLLGEGNAYLDREFPLLDHLIRATVVTPAP
jgi:cyclophilin family peptidyl-prolyl cis-trans isomerase